MTPQRIGIITDEVSPQLDDALDWIKSVGLAHVEVRMIDAANVTALNDAAVDNVRRKTESRGLFISGVASPLFKCALDPSRPVASGDRFGQVEESVEAHFEKLHRVIAIAKRLNTPRIRIFSFWREKQPEMYRAQIVAHLKRAAAIAGPAGVQLLLENEPSCNGGFADEVAAIVRAVDTPALRALWDPGNEAYGGREAFPAGYAALRGLVAHVHLKDAYITADGSPKCVPLGSGNVAWIDQFRALRDDGYQGLFTIETHFAPAGGSKKAGNRMTLDALRALLAEIG